jgi:hypothetical protein
MGGDLVVAIRIGHDDRKGVERRGYLDVGIDRRLM